MAHFHTTRAAILKLGRRVRAYRVAAGLSQEELGRRALVTGKFIGQIERGESNSSVASLALIADAMGCELSDLFQPENGPYAYVSIRSDDARKAQEALTFVASVLKPRTKRARR